MSSSESTKAPESFQVPERSSPSLVNHRNLAYSILKKLGDDAVKDAEFTELGKCPQCDKDILSPPFEAFTTLPCGHVFHRECVKNKFLLTCQNNCPVADCNATVKPVVSERRFSVTSVLKEHPSGSQSTAASLVRRMSNQLQVDSPVIQEDPMEGVQDTLNQETETRLTCAKCSEEITVDFSKDTVFLSCKHAVHFDCIDDPRKKCPTCPSADDLETIPIRNPISVEQASSTTQKKRSRESGASTENSSSKKAKKTGGKKVSSMLKKLIEELLTDVPVSTAGENLEEANESATSIFLQLSDKIDNAETKNESASRGLIFSYFDFGEAVFKRYKELKLEHGKDGSLALVKSEVREAIPETKCSDEALRKKMERSEKVYKLFDSIGKEKIARIKSTPPGFILNLTKDEKDYVIAEILKQKVR